ncbi:MAG: hypothetical protein ABSC94_27300 [Polyangiaceae bacterium]
MIHATFAPLANFGLQAPVLPPSPDAAVDEVDVVELLDEEPEPLPPLSDREALELLGPPVLELSPLLTPELPELPAPPTEEEAADDSDDGVVDPELLEGEPLVLDGEPLVLESEPLVLDGEPLVLEDESMVDGGPTSSVPPDPQPMTKPPSRKPTLTKHVRTRNTSLPTPAALHVERSAPPFSMFRNVPTHREALRHHAVGYGIMLPAKDRRRNSAINGRFRHEWLADPCYGLARVRRRPTGAPRRGARPRLPELRFLVVLLRRWNLLLRNRRCALELRAAAVRCPGAFGFAAALARPTGVLLFPALAIGLLHRMRWRLPDLDLRAHVGNSSSRTCRP